MSSLLPSLNPKTKIITIRILESIHICFTVMVDLWGGPSKIILNALPYLIPTIINYTSRKGISHPVKCCFAVFASFKWEKNLWGAVTLIRIGWLLLNKIPGIEFYRTNKTSADSQQSQVCSLKTVWGRFWSLWPAKCRVSSTKKFTYNAFCQYSYVPRTEVENCL